ncbi:MAG: ABC transporter permease, partial [Chitinophagales bacterium]|nr:ABC transporter permease [Chitinophagales bacterium]
MKNIITIFRKEFLDLSRDKRTLRTMLIIPLFLYPVIITGVSKYMGHQSKNAREEGIKIGVIQNGNETIFNTFSTWNQQKIASLQNDSAQLTNAMMHQEVIMPPTFITLRNDTTQIKKLIDEDSVDAVLWFGPGFDTSIKYNQPADYKLFYDSGKNGFKNDMIFGISTAFKNYIVHERFADMQIDKNILSPFVEITEVNLATEQQQIGEIIGGILPYFFIIFCLLGCMYPGIDMGAGEKERGTLETLLVSSAGRLEIYLG